MKSRTINSFLPRLKSRQLLHFAICMMVGLLLATLPHLVMLWKTGKPYYIADHDDLLYLSIAGQSYFNHPFSLSDPMFDRPDLPSSYPYLQFAPGILPARFLVGSPFWINLFWRTFAGASIGATWALVLRALVTPLRFATVLTVILLSDIGLLTGHLFATPITTALAVVFGHSDPLFASNPHLAVQWRIITPGLSLAYLLFHLWAVARLREEFTAKRLCFSAFSFALLFYVYFYYWTAAIVALGLCFLLDRRRRMAYFWTGLIGVILGSPALLAGFLLKNQSRSTDWLQRTDNFLPIPHFSELLVPVLGIGVTAVAFFWVYFRRRQYLYVWSLAAAGLLLANHQIASGMQIQNFHFVFVWGPMVSLLMALALAEWGHVVSKRFSRLVTYYAAIAMAVILFGIGIWLRFLETVRTRETIEISRVLSAYIEQRPFTLAERRVPLAEQVIAGDPWFVELATAFGDARPLYHYIALFSREITDKQLSFRIALNQYLIGKSKESFEAEQRRALAATVWGPMARDRRKREERLQERLKAFQSVTDAAVPAVAEYRVRYVALAAGQYMPRELVPHFRITKKTSEWTIWENLDP